MKYWSEFFFQFKFISPAGINILSSLLDSLQPSPFECLMSLQCYECLSPLPEVLFSLSLCSAVFSWTKSGGRGQQRSFLIVYLPQLWKGELLEHRGVCSSLVQSWGWCRWNSKWGRTRQRCSCVPVKPSQHKAWLVLDKGKASELYCW